MRTFIALNPNEEFLDSLLRSLLPLKEKYPHLRWIQKENLHITLVFLGEIDKEQLPLVKTAAEAALGSGEINAMGSRLFTLPPRREANVLALGFEKGREEISSLAALIKERLKISGIFLGENERKGFIPHITVARKGREHIRLLEDELTVPVVQGKLNNLRVYKSDLLPQGPLYSVLASYVL